MHLCVLAEGVCTRNEFNNVIKTKSKSWTDTVLRYLPRGKAELTEACLLLALTPAQSKLHGSPQLAPPGIFVSLQSKSGSGITRKTFLQFGQSS